LLAKHLPLTRRAGFISFARMKTKNFVKTLILFSFCVSAFSALAVQDISKTITDGDVQVRRVWPELHLKPTREARACRDKLFDITKIAKEARFLYESRFLSFCRFNEYRMAMYQGCVQKLASEIRTLTPDTVPSFCNHSHDFSKNNYEQYTSCLSIVYGNTKLQAGFVSSMCERSEGKKAVVDCLVDAFKDGGSGLDNQDQLQRMDACLKI